MEEAHLVVWGKRVRGRRRDSGAGAGKGGAVGPGRRPRDAESDSAKEQLQGKHRGAAEARTVAVCKGQGQALMGLPGLGKALEVQALGSPPLRLDGVAAAAAAMAAASPAAPGSITPATAPAAEASGPAAASYSSD